MRDEKGFSLAEVLVAFLILTLVITVSFTAFVERNKRLQQAAEIVLAYQVLGNEAEWWRRVPFNNVNNGTAFYSSKVALAPFEPVSTIVKVEKTKPGLKLVTLILRWHHNEREAKLGLVRVYTGGSNLW
jgi:Tfp pilus assembly protein PilV